MKRVTQRIQKHIKLVSPYRKVVFVFVLIFILTILFFLLRAADSSRLEVVFFDVGQGDGALIKTPLGNTILIDTGANYIASQKVEEYLSFLFPSLSTLLLTHPDLDHVGGANKVIVETTPRYLVLSGVGDYEEYRVAASSTVHRGDVLQFSGRGKSDIMLEILNPTVNMFGNNNHTSLVTRFVYGKFEYIFMGDADAEVERELIASGFLGSDYITVLKLGHHGSNTSSSEVFLKTIKPEYCIISAGRNNSYGHPHKEVLERLEKYCGTVYRTDEDGDIITKTDGNKFWVDFTR